MKTTFSDFISLNENNSIISLIDLENLIGKVFTDTKIQSIKTLYEKTDDGLKFVISINNLFSGKSNILHTKFIFYTDDKKTKLINNSFKYLYDINCDYKDVQFDDIIQLEEVINNIIENKEFGYDIINISNIYVTMATDINKSLKNSDIANTSVYNVEYTPLVDIIPCQSFSFNFKLNINDTIEIKLNIKKVSKSEYKYSFKNNDWFEDITKSDIKGTIDTIIEVLKKYIK